MPQPGWIWTKSTSWLCAYDGRNGSLFTLGDGVDSAQDSVATIREIVNFLMLRGNLGRPGAGVCPVRGHSNVQGDRTMGIWEKPTASWLDALRDEFRFDLPRRHGFDVVQ